MRRSLKAEAPSSASGHRSRGGGHGMALVRPGKQDVAPHWNRVQNALGLIK